MSERIKKMSIKIFETILQDLLEYYLGLDDVSLQKHLNDSTWTIKELVATINNFH